MGEYTFMDASVTILWWRAVLSAIYTPLSSMVRPACLKIFIFNQSIAIKASRGCLFLMHMSKAASVPSWLDVRIVISRCTGRLVSRLNWETCWRWKRSNLALNPCPILQQRSFHSLPVAKEGRSAPKGGVFPVSSPAGGAKLCAFILASAPPPRSGKRAGLFCMDAISSTVLSLANCRRSRRTKSGGMGKSAAFPLEPWLALFLCAQIKARSFAAERAFPASRAGWPAAFFGRAAASPHSGRPWQGANKRPRIAGPAGPRGASFRRLACLLSIYSPAMGLFRRSSRQ